MVRHALSLPSCWSFRCDSTWPPSGSLIHAVVAIAHFSPSSRRTPCVVLHVAPPPCHSAAARDFSVAGSGAPEDLPGCSLPGQDREKRVLWRGPSCNLDHGAVRKYPPPLPAARRKWSYYYHSPPILALAGKGLIPSDKPAARGLSLSYFIFPLLIPSPSPPNTSLRPHP